MESRSLQVSDHALMHLKVRIVMPREIITTPNVPSSPLYRQGVKAGPNVVVSGCVLAVPTDEVVSPVGMAR